MNERFIIVNIYRNSEPSFAGNDATNGGVTSTEFNNKFVVEAEGGNFTREEVEANGWIILKVRTRFLFGSNYHNLYAESDEGKMTMFGGNYAYTSDSRFKFDYPLPVHDRIE